MRKLDKEDLKRAYELIKQLRTELSFKEFEAKFDLASKTQNYSLFGFEDEKSDFIALCGVMSFNVLYHTNCLYICDFVVDEKKRGQGLGRKCLQNVELWAKNEGFEEIELSSSFPRTQAHEFYEKKMNFAKTGFVFKKKL